MALITMLTDQSKFQLPIWGAIVSALSVVLFFMLVYSLILTRREFDIITDNQEKIMGVLDKLVADDQVVFKDNREIKDKELMILESIARQTELWREHVLGGGP